MSAKTLKIDDRLSDFADSCLDEIGVVAPVRVYRKADRELRKMGL